MLLLALVVSKDKIMVLGPGFGLQRQVLGLEAQVLGLGLEAQVLGLEAQVLGPDLDMLRRP